MRHFIDLVPEGPNVGGLAQPVQGVVAAAAMWMRRKRQKGASVPSCEPATEPVALRMQGVLMTHKAVATEVASLKHWYNQLGRS